MDPLKPLYFIIYAVLIISIIAPGLNLLFGFSIIKSIAIVAGIILIAIACLFIVDVWDTIKSKVKSLKGC